MTAAMLPPNDRRLARLKTVVQEAVDFASQWPEEYRPQVFSTALDHLTGGTPAEPQPRVSAGTPVPIANGLVGLAQEIAVDIDALARTVRIDDDGKVSIMGRLGGRTTSELQVHYSVVHCFVREQALREFNTPIDDLRELCHTHGCYDMRNFTANFRSSKDLLREIGAKGAHDRSYCLSPKGVETAKALLKAMAEV